MSSEPSTSGESSESAAPGRPQGREAVRQAVLQAATRRFAAEGMSASLRDIAADANVNIGLIHRHLGNKDDLLRQVLAAQAQAGAALVEEARDPATALEWMFTHVGRGGDYTRMVAWLLLSGRQRDYQREYPTIAALRTQLGPKADSVSLLGAMAMLYGWTVFGDQLLDAFEISADERAGLERQLGRLAAGMLQLPSQD